MFNIGGGEVLVILLIALIVLGPDKLPNAARQAGKYLGDFRRMSSGFQRELKDAMDLDGLDVTLDLVASPGGPTAQPPKPAASPTVTPSADAAPIETNPPATSTATAAASTAGTSTDAAGTGTGTNGSATATSSSTANGTATAAPATPSADATTPAVVRKGMIEVDGPSSSFG